MSSEVKHYYFDSANYGKGIRFATVGEKTQNLGINYIPYDRPEYQTVYGEESVVYSTNFLMLFNPETIFPRAQGTGSVDTIVGNKFKWLNTMIDLEIKSLGVLSLYRIPCSAAVSSMTEAITTSSTGETYNTTVGTSTLDISQIAGRVLVNTGTGVGSSVTMTPGAVSTSVPVHQITQTQPYTLWTDKQEVTLIDSVGDRVRQGYSTTQAPLLMSPAFKPYYYCRFVVVRMNVSFTDYMTLKANSGYWLRFFNGLWWDRSSIALSTGPRRNMSQRVNDYNVTNPFGGMFDIVYNKKLKVNPFKVYRMRYNLKSARRTGDLITIKTDNPLVPVPESGSDYMYNNGNYFGFLLAPLSIDDFDPITQQYIIAQSPVIPGTTTQKTFMRGVNDTRDNWIDPALRLGNIDYPMILKCGESSLYARTAYLD